MIRRARLFAFALFALLAAVAVTAAIAPAARADLPSDFTVTSDEPTVDELGDIIEFLVATDASDEAKAANLEGGMDAVIVPKTVYNLGLYRAPRGTSDITAITDRADDSVFATLEARSAGRPTVNTTVEFTRIDGTWKLSNNSICHGVKTVGLNIYCNA